MIKKFLSWKNPFCSFDRWWKVLVIWRMSFCNDLRWSWLVSVSRYVKFTKLNVFCIWPHPISWFFSNIAILFLKALISSVLFGSPNKKLNREWIIPLLVHYGLVWSRVAKILSIWPVNCVILNLQSVSSSEQKLSKAEYVKIYCLTSHDLWSK